MYTILMHAHTHTHAIHHIMIFILIILFIVYRTPRQHPYSNHHPTGRHLDQCFLASPSKHGQPHNL